MRRDMWTVRHRLSRLVAATGGEEVNLREKNNFVDEQRKCERCGKEFTFTASAHRQYPTGGRFCSQKCCALQANDFFMRARVRQQAKKKMRRVGYFL